MHRYWRCSLLGVGVRCLYAHYLLGEWEVLFAPQWMFGNRAGAISEWMGWGDCLLPQLTQGNPQIRHLERVINCRHGCKILLTVGGGDVYLVHKFGLASHISNGLKISLHAKVKRIIFKITTSGHVLF